jgi:uncharacterized protein
VATNINTDKGIRSFFDKEFDKRPEIHRLSSNMVANFDKWNSMSRKNEDAKKEYNDIHYLIEYLKLFSGNFYDHYRSILDDKRIIVRTPTGTCTPFSLRVFITVRKDIIACERIGFEHILGRVTNKKIEIDFESITNFYNNIFNRFKIQCENCFIKESCKVCAMSNEHYFKKNFKCEEFYSISRFEKCISECIKTLRERAYDFNIINDII